VKSGLACTKVVIDDSKRMDAEASSEMALEKKKCVPCETGKLQPMSEEKAHSLLPEVTFL